MHRHQTDLNPSSAQLLQVVLTQLESLDNKDPPSSPSSSTANSKRDSSETASVRSEDTESTFSAGVEITLNNLGITSLPLDVADAIKHVVGKLSLQGNLLTSLPKSFLSMEKLTYLDLSHNNFSTFPSVVGSRIIYFLSFSNKYSSHLVLRWLFWT